MTGPAVRDRVFLVGLSGAGKSGLARAVAVRLGWSALDCDDEIARRAGMSIPRIFSERGESAFRALEREVVHAFAACPGRVVALGAGAFGDSGTRALLLHSGLVVWLKVRPATALKRLAPALAGEPRPMLGNEPETRLRELLEARSPAYAQAHLHVDTDDRAPRELAGRVAAALRCAPRERAL